MKKKITILLVIFALIIVFYSYTQIHSTKINKTKNISIKKLTKTNLNTIAYFTGLNYLYSINIESKIKNTVSGYLGPGKAADSVIKIKNNEYAISNESSQINICKTGKCSQGNFVSIIKGYTQNGIFYNFQGVGDLAFYKGYLYATDVIRGVIVKINIQNFSASAIVTGLTNPHGIYFYNNNLYINLEYYIYQNNKCSLIKVNPINWNVSGCVTQIGGYADGVAGYQNKLYVVRDYYQSSGMYNASVYLVNLQTLKYTNLINVNNQYIDGIGYNSKSVLAVFRSANPDSIGTKHYNHIPGLYNISNGIPTLLVSGTFDGVYFPAHIK